MRIRPEVTHYASVLVLSITCAVLVAYAYLRVHAEITIVEQAQGYVDPVLQVGIWLGFVVMVGADGALCVAAVWSGIRLLQSLRAKKS